MSPDQRKTRRRMFIGRRHVFLPGRTTLVLFALLAGLLAGCSRNDVKIISAVYGSGTNFADVSGRVADLVCQGPGFNADPGWLKVDPSPGWNKALVVIYQVNGHRHVFTAGEGDRVSAHILLEAARR